MNNYKVIISKDEIIENKRLVKDTELYLGRLLDENKLNKDNAFDILSDREKNLVLKDINSKKCEEVMIQELFKEMSEYKIFNFRIIKEKDKEQKNYTFSTNSSGQLSVLGGKLNEEVLEEVRNFFSQNPKLKTNHVVEGATVYTKGKGVESKDVVLYYEIIGIMKSDLYQTLMKEIMKETKTPSFSPDKLVEKICDAASSTGFGEVIDYGNKARLSRRNTEITSIKRSSEAIVYDGELDQTLIVTSVLADVEGEEQFIITLGVYDYGDPNVITQVTIQIKRNKHFMS